MYAMCDRSTTSESDTFFKSITPDEFTSTDGDVESPTGWFGIVSITDDFRIMWSGDQIPASVANGTYLVHIDSNGLVWAEQCATSEATRRNYYEMVKQYIAWSEDPDAECNDPGCQTCGDRLADTDTEA